MCDSAIVHLSDLECGENNRANRSTRVDAYRRGANSLVADVRRLLLQDRNIRPERIGLVFTGDIADKGADPEYAKAEEVILHIRDQLGIPHRQIAVIPGNHDVCWPACKEGFQQRFPSLSPNSKSDREQARCLSEKFAPFNRFCQRVCGREFGAPESVVLFDGLLDLGVAMVGIDTTYPCTFRKADNHGEVRDLPIQEAGRQLRQLLADRPRLIPIAALHHCPTPMADQVGDDDSYMYNGTEALQWLKQAGFGVVLCGHEHQTRCLAELREGYRVLSTGSYGLNAAGLINHYRGQPRVHSNKYQILLPRPETTSTLLLRRLLIPGGFDDSWSPDDSDGSPSLHLRLPRPQFYRGEAEQIAGQVSVIVTGPAPLPNGRCVVIMSLRAPRDVFDAINSVSYQIVGNGRELRATNRADRFRQDDQVARERDVQVKAWLETDQGTIGPITVEVPWAECVLAGR